MHDQTRKTGPNDDFYSGMRRALLRGALSCSDRPVSRFPLVADGHNSNEILARRVLVQRHVAASSTRNHKFSQGAGRPSESADHRVMFEDQNRPTNSGKILAGKGLVLFCQELEDALKIIERFWRQQNHGCFLARGFRGLAPVNFRSR